MPSKYSRKLFFEGAFYHVFNRGIDKRDIFLDDQDYKFFVQNLRRYLDPTFKLRKFDPKTGEPIMIEPDRLTTKVDLVAFCLMPNHFHLIVKLKELDGMTKLVKSVCNNYSSYFNNKYERSGKLFGDIYKAVRVNSQEQLRQLSRYIHLNPIKNNKSEFSLDDYQYSNLYYLIHDYKASWVTMADVIGDGSKEQYIKFVRSKIDNSFSKEELDVIESVSMEA